MRVRVCITQHNLRAPRLTSIAGQVKWLRAKCHMFIQCSGLGGFC
jgi:hypothetical protein